MVNRVRTADRCLIWKAQASARRMYLQKVENEKIKVLSPVIWGCSSAGRAPALQAGGQEFDPPHLHQGRRTKKTDVRYNNMGL